MLENLSADECAYVRFGQKRTFCDAGAMSALPPKADIARGKAR